MTHYYSDNSNLVSKKETFEYYFNNEKFLFTTDNGVFSKRNVDYGSYVLIKSVYHLDLGKRVLDLGCGYGPIGIIIKHFNPDIQLTMVDVNPRAISLAKENILQNDIASNILCEDNIHNIKDDFDSIILNPPIRAGKKVIYDLYEKSYQKLISGGSLYIVIAKRHGYYSTKEKLESIFTEVKVLDKDKGYFVLQASK